MQVPPTRWKCLTRYPINLETARMKHSTLFTLTTLFIVKMTSFIVPVNAQGIDSLWSVQAIAVLARPAKDSIVLRWTPLKLSSWIQGNNHGYLVERFTIIDNGLVSKNPVRLALTPEPFRPVAYDNWKTLVEQDPYASIPAQALYGDSFEIDLSENNILSMVNKVKENEQRFFFAIFCADMSSTVAQASALMYTDKNVNAGEKYLYRIKINSPDTLVGSVFVSPDDPYELPQPSDLKAESNDKTIFLRWNRSANHVYTAYIVEKSLDGNSFRAISDIPLLTIRPTDKQESKYEYAMDSLEKIQATYYYRVRGITPFAERGPASEIVTIKRFAPIRDVPHIISGENIDNKSIHVTWQFPSDNNTAIKGFSIERSLKANGIFTTLQGGFVSSQARKYIDEHPNQVNYYRLAAHGIDGTLYRSPVYLSQLVDSLPPSTPVGLKAKIDEFGNLELKWSANSDSDILGYRVYRGNVESEEASQVTTEPISDSTFADKVNLNTLNDAIYYSVMAIDRNQNHSPLSSALRVRLPDLLKPQAPVLLPYKSSENGVLLSWLRSSSEDVVHYDVYRKSIDRKDWMRLKIIASSNDSTYYFTDSNSEVGITNSYTVVAVDEAGLESDPAAPINAAKLDNTLRPAVQWAEHLIDSQRNAVALKWSYDQPDVRSFKVFKSIDGHPFLLIKTLKDQCFGFVDSLLPGRVHSYQVMAEFQNGSKSVLSKIMTIKY